MSILFARNLKQNSTPPPTPTNEDRLRQYRQAAPVTLANSAPRKWHRRSKA